MFDTDSVVVVVNSGSTKLKRDTTFVNAVDNGRLNVSIENNKAVAAMQVEKKKNLFIGSCCGSAFI